jgi:hypothetical protein
MAVRAVQERIDLVVARELVVLRIPAQPASQLQAYSGEVTGRGRTVTGL